MSIIQQRNSICRTILLMVLLEITSADKSISHQRICGNSNRRISYFKVNSDEWVWDHAWSQCKSKNSTLPVICNQHEQVALTNYQKAAIGSSVAWTSGKKTQFNEWKWIDGQSYTSTRVIRNLHELNTHVVLKEDRNYTAEHPMSKVYYLCQYSGSSCNSGNVQRVTNGCVTASDDDRSWYNARSQCLQKGGDLAILNDDDLVTLRGSNKLNTAHTYWIGLRKNAWRWIRQTEVPSDDSAEEVKYSNWSNDSNSLNGECISINASNGEWKAVRCDDKKIVICQASPEQMTSSTSSVMATHKPTNSSRPTSSNTTSTMSSKTESETQGMTNVDPQVLLYSGVGAGIVIIIICIIIIILVVRGTRKPHKETNQLKVKSNSEQNRLDVSPNKQSIPPGNAAAYTSVTGADYIRSVYAEIPLAKLNQSEDGAKTQKPGIVYASVEFQKEPTYMEIR